MPLFKYEAVDSQGLAVKDQIEALSEKEAKDKIRKLGYFATMLEAVGEDKRKKKAAAAAPTRKRRGAGAKVKPKVLTQFARQFSTLQDAGLPILRSLRILQEQQKSAGFKRIIGNVADDIEGGSTLSEAMAHNPRCFDRLFTGMVAAGEAGGVLDLIMARIADFMEKAERLKSRVKSAMIYPVFVLIAAFAIVLLLMKFVIPSFSSVLQEMAGGEELPALTQYVLAISGWIATLKGSLIVIGTPIAAVFVYKLIRRLQLGRHVTDTIKLHLPILGQLSSKVAVTRWTRTLGTLIGAGVPILDAITVTSETAGNEVYSRMLNNVHNSIRQGDTFASPLGKSKTVDSIVVNMVSVGEETGDLDKMLLKIADNYDEQVDVLVGSLMSLLEPIMILFLGSIVLTIVLAIFLPIISVISSLSSGV